MAIEYRTYYKSKIGNIEIISSDEGITSVKFTEKKVIGSKVIPSCLNECVTELDEYFNKKRKCFTVKLQIDGTDFQKKVWQKLAIIPYGKIATYKEIAGLIGNKNAVRAVGNANGKNKIAILIPCHRVIGSNGELTGYAGGEWRKDWLLNNEKN